MIIFLTERQDHDPYIYKSAKIRVTDNLAEIDKMFQNLFLGLDTEGNGGKYHISEVLLIQLGNKENQLVIDFTDPTGTWRDRIKTRWNNAVTDKHIVIGHNLKHDLNVTKKHGLILPDLFDTMISSQRINLGSGLLNNLKDVYERELQKFFPEDKDIRKEFRHMDKFSTFKVKHISYGAADIGDIIEIASIFKRKMEETKQTWFIRNVEFPLIKVLSAIELKGLHLDEAKWTALIKKREKAKFETELAMDEEVKRLGKGNVFLTGGKYTNKRRKEVVVQTGLFDAGYTQENKNIKNLNYNSRDHVFDIFKKLNLPVPNTVAKKDKYKKIKNKTTKTEAKILVHSKGDVVPALNEAAINSYILVHPTSPMRLFLETLLSYKGYQKFISSYGVKFLNYTITKKGNIEPGYKNPVTNRVHTVLRQCFTDNGRLASGDKDAGLFNIQNLEATKEIREAFCLSQEEIAEGYWFTTVDWSGKSKNCFSFG